MVRDGERFFDVAIDSTLRAAILRQVGNRQPGAFSVAPADLRKKLFTHPRRRLIVFVVDASDSMGKGTLARMRAAKGAALAILARACQSRSRLAMVAFWDESAEVVLPPTASRTLAQERLKSMPTGGATPFADGLLKAWKVVRAERLKDPEITPLLVVISDGEANVPLDPARNTTRVMEELLALARRIGQERIHCIAIDTKPTWDKPHDMPAIAEALGAAYHHIDGLKAKNVVEFIAEY